MLKPSFGIAFAVHLYLVIEFCFYSNFIRMQVQIAKC